MEGVEESGALVRMMGDGKCLQCGIFLSGGASMETDEELSTVAVAEKEGDTVRPGPKGGAEGKLSVRREEGRLDVGMSSFGAPAPEKCSPIH